MPRPKRNSPARLTVGEIELLQTLWRLGPATIAEVHEGLDAAVGYTTVQTRLNRLVAKRVATKTSRRPAKYCAAVSADDVNRADLKVLVGRVNDGAFVPLVAHLIRDRSISEQELRELRALIDEAEQRLQTTEADHE